MKRILSLLALALLCSPAAFAKNTKGQRHPASDRGRPPPGTMGMPQMRDICAEAAEAAAVQDATDMGNTCDGDHQTEKRTSDDGKPYYHVFVDCGADGTFAYEVTTKKKGGDCSTKVKRVTAPQPVGLPQRMDPNKPSPWLPSNSKPAEDE